MSLEQILQILTPIAAGATGILTALIVFVSRIASLGKTVKAQLLDNEYVKEELKMTHRALNDLSQKISYVVEEVKEVKKNGRKNTES